VKSIRIRVIPPPRSNKFTFKRKRFAKPFRLLYEAKPKHQPLMFQSPPTHSPIQRTALAISLLTFCLTPLTQASNLMEITQKKSGKTIQVEIVSLTSGKLTFKNKNGKTFTIPTETITSKSLQKIQDQIKEAAEANADQFSKINTAISHPLFEGAGSLWTQPAETVAERLGWPKESTTDQSSSFRYYTPKSYQFLGAHPYSATLYGGPGGTVEHLSLVFANKGDFGSAAGMGEDHFKKIHPDTKPPTTLEEAIKTDAKLITNTLTQCLGSPKQQYYGEKEDRRKVLRWDMADHAFLLSEIKNEYVSLLIISKENADLAGKIHFVKDSDLKKLLAKNVIHKENGDTYIKNIPMVNQGPKGYCAPATFERAMRYMLIPADMYLLATAATKPGGGTNTGLLADSCKRIVRSKARRIKDLNLKKDLKIKKIKKFIDKGVPVLWQMRSLENYNQIANRRTKQRAAIQDFKKWAEDIAEEAKQVAPSLKNNDSNHHICMIIGYNEKTNELAVSDSWGPNYELRWVHLDIAKAVTSAGGFVIDF